MAPPKMKNDRSAAQVLLTVAALALAPFTAPALSAQNFFPPVTHPTGPKPAAVATGDLNGDGYAEIVVGQSFGLLGFTQLQIFSNNGSGGFTTPPLQIPVPGSGQDLVIDDVNNDTVPDIVVGIETPPAIAIFAGLGFGAFAPPTVLPIPVTVPLLFVGAVLVGDVNEDGHQDVLAMNSAHLNDQQLSLFLADGVGGYFAPVEIGNGLETDEGEGLLVDLNHDDHLDVVFSDVLMLGNGDGSFQAPTAHSLLNGSIDLLAVDLNEDGHLDLVDIPASGVIPRPIRSALGDGTGAFAPAVTVVVADKAISLSSADYDGDGHQDVAVAHAFIVDANARVTVLHGDGHGGLGSPLVTNVGYEGQSWELDTADFDVDGRPDIAVVNKNDDAFVLLRQQDGTLSIGAATYFSGTSFCSAVALGDLDGDGHLDAVMTRGHDTGAEQHLVRWLGDGTGALGSLVGYFAGGKQEDLALGDLNGDGLLDAVASMRDLDSVAIHLGSGGGHLAPAVLHAVGDAPSSIVLGDFNGDGHLDVATANEASHDVSLLMGDGLGSLGATSAVSSGGLESNALVAADFNEDGALDLAVANRDSEDVSLLLGDGLGGFLAPALHGASCASESIAVADLDGDGHLDLVVAGELSAEPSSGHIVAWLGDGAGGLGSPLSMSADGSCDDLTAGDLNGDGRPDLALASRSHYQVAIYLGVGNGLFQPKTDYHSPLVNGLALGDLTGDDRLDLVTALNHPTTYNAGVRLNLSQPHVWHDLGQGLAGSFGLPTLVGTGPLTAASSGTLRLQHANKNKLAVLFVAPSSAPAAFKGGVLVPVPPLVSFLLITSPQGHVPLSWPTWTPGVPGSSWYFQYAIVDAAGPAGASLSNALRALQP